MKKQIFFIIILIFPFLSFLQLSAQTRDTGREIVKGELNFTDAANYYLAHPLPLVRQEIENDEDNDRKPARSPIADPTLIHHRIAARTTLTHTADLPISPAPVDTFESTRDPGTAVPPDTHGAVDSYYCVTTINTTVNIQTRAGGAVSSVTLDAFWAPVLSGGGSFDPRAMYDPYTNRWFIVAVGGAESTTSCILIAVSKTSNPTGAWWMYKITTDGTGVNWLDFPDVGYNQKWLTVTGNYFSNSSGAFNGAKVFVFNKASLMTGAGAPYTGFLETSSFTICPAITYDPTLGSMFCVESYDGTASGGGTMQLWKIAGAVGSETLTSLGFPASTGVNWQDGSFAITGTSGADFAPQVGTANKLQTNDDRIDQVVYMQGKLWFSHTIWLPYSTSVNATRSSIQWWEIDTTGTPDQIGEIDDATGAKFYAFPSLAVNDSNDALMGYAVFSATTHPSCGYSIHMHGDPVDSMRPTFIFRHGQSTYYKTFSGTKNRWGDYASAVLDPTNLTSFWTIGEASWTTANDWDTWWAYVKLCSTPDVIAGTTGICIGSGTTLTDDSLGGTWSSSAAGIATIGSLTGVVTSVATGTTIITYTVPYGCYTTATVTVNPLPLAISGPAVLCTGFSANYTDGSGGGSWTSSNTAVATIGSSSGTLNGLTAGSSVITYTLTTGCITTFTVNINLAPASISGALSVCAGFTTGLTDSDPGGTWSSSATGTAGIGTSGTVNGVLAGTAVITYSLGAGCYTTSVFTVNPNPSGILGNAPICAGATLNLTDPTGGGTWSSDNTAQATIGIGSGIANGVSSGTPNISYILSTGCYATVIMTVNLVPAPITGVSTMCTATGTTMSDLTGGGTWISSNTGVATIGATTGIVAGLTNGTTTITYIMPSGCYNTMNLSVGTSPGAILGSASLCISYNTTLTDPTPGGTWSSSNAGVASIVAGSGFLTGVSSGTATITYSMGGGCFATTNAVVSVLPTAITGATNLCSSATTLLGDGIGGGSWSTSDGTIATIGSSSGLVSGVAAGTVIITYGFGTGCIATTILTLNNGPAPITGTTTLCLSVPTTLNDITGGGTWTSSITGVATVGATTGIVSGVTLGTSLISYTLSDGCFTTAIVTVAPASSSPIAGPANACIGVPTTFTDATGGGTWSSSNPAMASVGSVSGVVTGNTSGVFTLSYSVTTSCGFALTTRTVSVSPLPGVSPVSGMLNTCVGGNISLTDATSGGVWSSSNTAVAVIGTAGSITGIALGTSLISYTVTNSAGCSNSALATVNVTATFAITITPSGPTTFCTGGSVLLSAPTGAGYTYQWQVGGTNISGATTSALLVTTVSGNYTVIINNGSGCTSTSAPVSVTVNSSPIVSPSVFIKANPGNILCLVTSPVTFTDSSNYGGSSPAYIWTVNGIFAGAGTTFTYSPASGDVVKIKMTSNDICAFPDTAEASMTMDISARETPSVSISTNLGGIACAGSSIALNAIPVYGGSSPAYLWSLNGVPSATGPTYIIYTPVTGDIVKVRLTSDYPCLTTDTAISAPVRITVDPVVNNTITITVSESSIAAGQVDTFSAAAPGGGTSPAYQWYVNGTPVPGATNSIFITNALTNDAVVSCEVTSSDPCATPNPSVSGSITVKVGGSTNVANVSVPGGFTLVPNPNKGEFTISGTLDNPLLDQVEIKITNVLGQNIYSVRAIATNGLVNEHIKLNESTAAGIYLLGITAGDEHRVFHVVIDK